MDERNPIHRNSKLETGQMFVTLLKAVNLKVIGRVTKKEYIFNGAGSSNYVDVRDAETFADRANKTSCCGSVGSPYFEIVR